MKKSFIHPSMGVEQRSMAGFYTADEVLTLKYKDRPVLYITGTLCLEYSCAGSGSWNYIQVIGYLLENKRNEKGEIISEVETVDTEEDRINIKLELAETYPGIRVEYRYGL